MKEKSCYSKIFPKCCNYGISLWKCPQFLFTIMGIIIIFTAVFSYFLGVSYMISPEIIAVFVLILTSILLVIAFVITRSFEDLAESNKLKTEFVNIVSHQLRTPLSNLKWGLDAFKNEKEKTIGSQEEYVQVLSENIERMNDLVSDLLITSRIQQKRLTFLKEEVDLNKVVEKSIDNFKLFAKASNVEINFKGDPTIPSILIDPIQIKIVIDNLIDNAIKYTTSSKFIDIELGKSRKGIFFRIIDQGVGIPEADKKNIFEKFFRSKNVLKYQTSGTGLGLYISKAIIEFSKGEIGFKSREGKGTTFWFTLPF
jgi:signal transduction histidine kinase